MISISTPQNSTFDRVIWVVLDGVGAGELPDAKLYGDHGANTLGNLSRSLKAKHSRTLALPNMTAWGLGSITSIEGIEPKNALLGGEGAFGRALEQSKGKDTSSGHWEMAGLVVMKPFATYPNGFPQEIVDRWVKENNLPGVLGNKAASGTEILEELGVEHMESGKPILYTSADSVWQVAAHEQSFGLERLYSICKSARKICDELQLGRVIARPFVGSPREGTPFKRTYHRKDYSQPPFAPTYLDRLISHGIPTLGIGKISAIFAGQGISDNIDTAGNTDGIRVLIEQIKAVRRGLIFCNLIDFDMVFGHRRDPKGFAEALEEFDRAIPEIKALMNERDLLILTADHGNDPTFRGSDHTREYAPLLVYSPLQRARGPIDLGTLDSFADIGATVLEALLGETDALDQPSELAGKSFLGKLLGEPSDKKVTT